MASVRRASAMAKGRETSTSQGLLVSILLSSCFFWKAFRSQEERRWSVVRRYDNGECLGEPTYVSKEDDTCHEMIHDPGDNQTYRSFLVQYDCDRLEERYFFYCTDEDCQECTRPSWNLSEPGQCHRGGSSSWEHVCPGTIVAEGSENHALILHFDDKECSGRPDRTISEGICTPCPFQGGTRCEGMSHVLVQYDCDNTAGEHRVVFCEDASCSSCKETDAMSLEGVEPNVCIPSTRRQASWQILCSNSRVSSTPRIHGEAVFYDNSNCTGNIRRLSVDGVCNVIPDALKRNLPESVNVSSFITYYDCETDPSVSDEEWADTHYILTCQDDNCRYCSETVFPVQLERPGICTTRDGILGLMHVCPDNVTGEVILPSSASGGNEGGSSGISVGAFVGGLVGGILGGLLLGATGMAYAFKQKERLAAFLVTEEASQPPSSVALTSPHSSEQEEGIGQTST